MIADFVPDTTTERRMTDCSSFAYSVYGLTLISDMKLTLPETAWRREADTVVTLATRDAETLELATADLTLDPERWFQQTLSADGSLYMRWKDCLDLFITRDGARVTCRNLSTYSLELLESYLINFAVSSALLLHGEETLHATVVDIGGRAIGLLGHSGAGKSSLASFLRTCGGKIVTDDILRISFDEGAAIAHPGPHQLKLFAEPAELFLPDSSASGKWSPAAGKFVYHLGDQTRVRPPCRLVGLYELRAQARPDDKRVVVERKTARDSFLTIGASTTNNTLETPARPGRHFRFVARLARLLPVYSLTYPKTFEVFDEVADKIHRSAPA
jgi:hypothetical protein